MTFRFATNLLILLMLVSGGAEAAKKPAKAKPAAKLDTEVQKSSYAQGVRYIEYLQKSEIPFDQELFLLGVNDFLDKKPLRLNPEQLQKWQDWLLVQQALHNDKMAKDNLQKGTTFMTANKQKPGVVSLPSGLQYKPLAAGANPQHPKTSDVVTLEYEVHRINGEKLIKSGENPSAPAQVQVGQLPKGWQEATLLMKEGDKWQLFIPPNLAYGENGFQQGGVGPNETLIYDVSLLKVETPIPGKNPATPPPAIKKSSSW
ncbi:MAG: FKBP-type peptidyl-prolyl cis-trans isomerase [Methyloglobulus sp.]|nr:FKBP-type peptidyl-prolyl cis-trans isomerase [Methyloglobulus sp.]